MASIRVDGLDELMEALGGIDAEMDDIVDEMLDAKGDVVVTAQKKTAAAMLRGKYYKGAVAEAVTKGKTKKTQDGKALEITFEGEQHGNRLAEIAFVNEFGKTNQEARPFIETANNQSADAAAEKAADVLDKRLKQKGL